MAPATVLGACQFVPWKAVVTQGQLCRPRESWPPAWARGRQTQRQSLTTGIVRYREPAAMKGMTICAAGRKVENARTAKDAPMGLPGTSIPENWPMPEAPKVIQMATAVGFGICATLLGTITNGVLNAVEQIPFLPEVETLVGLAVCTQFARKFLTADSGRARLEAWFDNVLNRVAGKDLQDEADESGPRMLEVQLRSTLDEELASEDLAVLKSGPAQASAFNRMKQGVVTSMMNFVRRRESQSRRVTTVLRQDLEREQAQTRQYKEGQADLKEAAQAAKAEVQQLSTKNKELQVERDEALAQVALLSQQVDDVTTELSDMTAAFRESEKLVKELNERVAAVMAEKRAELQGLGTTSKAQASEIQALKADLEKVQLSYKEEKQQFKVTREELGGVKGLLRTKKAELEKERQVAALKFKELQEEAAAAVARVQERVAEREADAAQERQKAVSELASMEARMTEAVAELSAERDSFASAAADLEQRLEAILAEKEEQAGQVAMLEAALQQAEAGLATNLARTGELKVALEEAEGEAKQAAAAETKVAALEAMHRAAESASGERVLAWERAHNNLQTQQETETQNLQGQLAEAEKSSRQYGAEVDRLRADLAVAAVKSKEQEAELEEASARWRDAAGRAQAAQAKLSETAVAAKGAVAHAAKLAPGVAAVAKRKAGRKSLPTSALTDLKTKPQLSTPVTVSSAAAQVVELAAMPPEKIKELQAYARRVRSQFVDLTRPAKEQPNGVDLFTKALAEKGATEDWARKYIIRSMSYARNKGT